MKAHLSREVLVKAHDEVRRGSRLLTMRRRVARGEEQRQARWLVLVVLAVVVGALLAVLPGATSPSTTYAATFSVNSDNDVDDGTCNVAHCSLREAINASNASTGVKDTINFSIGTGKKTITPAGSALPTVTDPVIIDGTTQNCSPDSTPCIELDGTSAGASADGLAITAGNSTVRGLVINRFSHHGIHLVTAGSNVIEGNYIGTDVTGAIALANVQGGVAIKGAHDNTIGGTAAGARNVISGNGAGVVVDGPDADRNLIKGNYIGTDVTGTAAIANGVGVELGSGLTETILGGEGEGEGNVISGNNLCGVVIRDATDTTVEGNLIGVQASGTLPLHNVHHGVLVTDASSGTVVRGNVISANWYAGVFLAGVSSDTAVQGNYIGTNSSGAALGNERGVDICEGAHDNTIGGTGPGQANTIAYNTLEGVKVNGADAPPGTSTTRNTISGNSIYSNGTKGIATPSGGNNDLAPPVITSVGGSVTGHTSPKCYPCTVEVLSDSDGQGRIYHGSTATNNDATGTWTYTGAATGPKITATVTDSSGNTSEFSAPYSGAVGGIAELPVLAGTSYEQAGAPAGASGWSAGAYAALAAGLAAAVLALGGGAWYARRRWLT